MKCPVVEVDSTALVPKRIKPSTVEVTLIIAKSAVIAADLAVVLDTANGANNLPNFGTVMLLSICVLLMFAKFTTITMIVVCYKTITQFAPFPHVFISVL